MKSSAADPSKSPTPADIAQAQCTCLQMRRVSRRLTQRYDEFLAPSGLRITQFALLAMLQGNEAPSISALAEKMDMERTTLTRNLRPLIDGGLATLGDGPNARTRALAITAEGRKAFQRCLAYWRQAQNDTRDRMGMQALDRLHETLNQTMTKLFG